MREAYSKEICCSSALPRARDIQVKSFLSALSPATFLWATRMRRNQRLDGLQTAKLDPSDNVGGTFLSESAGGNEELVDQME